MTDSNSIAENNQAEPAKKSGRGGARANSGGARPGSGRKKGSATLKTRAIADAAAAAGITPLEVMINTMRALYDRYQALVAMAPEGTMLDLTLLKDASAIAKDAAPYMHPRLAAIEHTGADGGAIQTVSRIELVPLAPGEKAS